MPMPDVVSRSTPAVARACLLAGATVAVTFLATTAGATTTHAATAGARVATAFPTAAPFVRSWARVPQSQALRRKRRIVVVGQEQDVAGLNTSLACCNVPWAEAQAFPVIRGAFVTNARLESVKDLVASAHATPTTLSYTIRKNATWDWGGRRLPVTYQDFVYTWQQMVDPRSNVAGRDGYAQITGFTHRGDKQITFTWSKPYGPWRLLFSTVYPSAALAGTDFNTIWTSCICGSDGKPVSDGPFVLTNYTRGQGATLKANPHWYGRRARLREIDFKVVPDTFAEVQAMRRGKLDVVDPTFGVDLLPLEHARGLTYDQVPGLFQEHLDIQLGKLGQPLLRAPWMRRAIMMGIDRATLIKTVLGDFAAGVKPLDNLLYYQADPSYRPDFRRWDYNPRKALALLKRHCTGGPATVGGAGETWACSGYEAKFRYTWSESNAVRATQEAIVTTQLARIGIEIVGTPLPDSAVFGPAGIPSGNYDLADFAWITAPDPVAFVPTWSCGGQSNYLGYCSSAVTELLAAANDELEPKRRSALFERADRLLANDLPAIPLYSRPSPLVWRSGILGMKNNPSPAGFTWNAQQWRWKS